MVTTAMLLGVPTISRFYGIKIEMHWDEHPPPHFHALYERQRAAIDIRRRQLIKGSLRPRALALILEWVHLHESELLENWDLCAANQPPKPIPPLP